MKNKRRAQLAEKVYFENEIKNSKELIQKGKKLQHSIPHLRIVNEILDPYLILLKQPRPFNKIKTSQKSYTIQNSYHNQLQYLEQLKGCHFERESLAKIVQDDSQFIPQTAQYGNTLLLDYDMNSTVQLRYFDESKINQIEINLQEIIDGVLNVKDIQVEQEIIQDYTGIYELFQMKSNTYFRHLYSVEVFDSNFKAKTIYKSNNILQSICLKNETDTLYMLSQAGIRNQDNYLWKQSENTQSPYQVQSLHNHYNPYCLFALSMGEIKLFDSRKQQMHILISQENSELLNNRFFTMHQFQEPQYLVVSTNRNLQYYDLRNPQNVLFKQKHNCTETGLNQLVPLKSTLNFMNSLKFKDLDRTILDLSFEKRDILIGYSNEHKGPGVLIEFKGGIVNNLLEQPNLRVIANLLSSNSIQNASKDQIENGVPQSICTHNIKNKYLKQRGFQGLRYKDRLFCFSLDQQGGIGVQLFGLNLDPIQINQNLNYDQMKYFEFSRAPDIDQPKCKQNKQDKYEKIFDQLEQFSEEELELMEIPELQVDIKKKKKKLISIDIKEFPLQDNPTEEPGVFEDLILLNNTVDKQSSFGQNCQINNKFILTQAIIDDLCEG